jgi:hypothetical protein
MWELRLFSKKNLDEHIPDSITEPLRLKEFEKRVDCYYQLGLIDCGLKERWYWQKGGYTNPLFELKVLYQRDPMNIEFWDKVMKEALSEDINIENGLSRDQIVNFIEKSNITIDIKHRVLNWFKEPKRIPIFKERKQVNIIIEDDEFYELNGNQEYFIFERTNIYIEEEKYFTYIIESDNLELIHEVFRKVFGVQILTNYRIMGYPEFISRIQYSKRINY